jgi:hypothetical protein
MRRVLNAGLSALAVGILLVASAAAVTFTATLEPIRIKAVAGLVASRHFRLTLPADQPRTVFRAHVEDFWRSEDGKQSFYRPPGTLSRSCGKWVTLDPVEAAVDPGRSLDIRLTVAVPADVGPGGYWCVLTVDEVPDPAAAPTGVAIRFLASVSVAVYVTIEPAQRSARIVGVQLDGDQAVVTVENTGDTPLPVEGRVEFFLPGAEKPLTSVPIPRSGLLPEPVRRATMAVALPARDVLPSGRYRVRVLLDIGLDHLIGVQNELEVRRDPLAAPHP